MFMISWQLTLFFLVAAPIISLVVRKTSVRMRKLSTQVQNAIADVSHVSEEAIEGYKVIRTFGGEQYEQEKECTKHADREETAEKIGPADVPIVVRGKPAEGQSGHQSQNERTNCHMWRVSLHHSSGLSTPPQNNGLMTGTPASHAKYVRAQWRRHKDS